MKRFFENPKTNKVAIARNLENFFNAPTQATKNLTKGVVNAVATNLAAIPVEII